MKKFFFVLGFMVAFQVHCQAMAPNAKTAIYFEQDIVTSETFDTYFYVMGSSFYSGFNNAISFPMEEKVRAERFAQGMKYVKNGEFNLIFIREVKYTPYPYGTYVAHILYAIQPGHNGTWTRIRHAGYLGEESLWSPGFTVMFEEIQKSTQQPLACLVYDDPENQIWKRVITALGFVARPDIPRSEDDQECTWYIRPIPDALKTI